MYGAGLTDADVQKRRTEIMGEAFRNTANTNAQNLPPGASAPGDVYHATDGTHFSIAADDAEAEKQLTKLHRALLHPDKSAFTKWMGADYTDRVAGIMKKIYDNCKFCKNRVLELPRTAAATLPRARIFNHRVAVDLMFVVAVAVWIIHVVCCFTRLSGAAVIEDRTAASVLHGFQNCWATPYGWPQHMDVDTEGCLTSKIAKE